MNMQIEEIARSMCRNCGTQVCVSCDAHATCMIHLYAGDVYAAGYRKKSENMVEVVRCKDCAHFQMVNSRAMCSLNAKKEGILWLGLKATADDGFCHHGEKMKGGE